MSHASAQASGGEGGLSLITLDPIIIQRPPSGCALAGVPRSSAWAGLECLWVRSHTVGCQCVTRGRVMGDGTRGQVVRGHWWRFSLNFNWQLRNGEVMQKSWGLVSWREPFRGYWWGLFAAENPTCERCQYHSMISKNSSISEVDPPEPRELDTWSQPLGGGQKVLPLNNNHSKILKLLLSETRLVVKLLQRDQLIKYPYNER